MQWKGEAFKNIIDVSFCGEPGLGTFDTRPTNFPFFQNGLARLATRGLELTVRCASVRPSLLAKVFLSFLNSRGIFLSLLLGLCLSCVHLSTLLPFPLLLSLLPRVLYLSVYPCTLPLSCNRVLFLSYRTLFGPLSLSTRLGLILYGAYLPLGTARAVIGTLLYEDVLYTLLLHKVAYTPIVGNPSFASVHRPRAFYGPPFIGTRTC